MAKTFRRIVLASSTVVITAFLVLAGLLYLRSRTPPRDFLKDEANYYAADAIAGHLHRPYAHLEFAWNEHYKGKIEFRTNDLGFREDRDTAIEKADNSVRILVAGDSHTDGVVYNAESFPNILEDKLNSGSRSLRFEVINGGVGYYTFQNYAGFLRRHLDLKPDYFVVTVYLGNDFMEAIQLATKRGQIPEQPRPIWYRFRLWRAAGPMLNQAGNQIVYFDTYPEMKTKALEIGHREFKDIKEVCLQHQIQLMVVLLPTKLDVEEKAKHDAAGSLGLSEGQLELNQGLKRTLISVLEQEQVAYLDMTDYMKNQNFQLFWNQDYHLNDKGHRLVAQVLFRYFSVALTAPSSDAATR